MRRNKKDFKSLKKKVFEDDGRVNKNVFEESMVMMMEIEGTEYREEEEDKENTCRMLNNNILSYLNAEDKIKKTNGKVKEPSKRNDVLTNYNY